VYTCTHARTRRTHTHTHVQQSDEAGGVPDWLPDELVCANHVFGASMHRRRRCSVHFPSSSRRGMYLDLDVP